MYIVEASKVEDQKKLNEELKEVGESQRSSSFSPKGAETVNCRILTLQSQYLHACHDRSVDSSEAK